MDNLNIAIIKTQRVCVGDRRDGDYWQYHNDERPLLSVENNPMLFVDPYRDICDIENLKIKEFVKVRNGVETRKLIAVHSDVYEELYSIPDDDIRAEVLSNHKQKIQSLEGTHKLQVSNLYKIINERDSKIGKLKAAKFLTRLKWLVMGVDK